jgi:hypothetical protein
MTFAYHQGIKPELVERVPFIPRNYTYGLVLAPYGRFEPRDNGKPDHGIGITFSLRTLTKLKKEQPTGAPGKPEDWPGGEEVGNQKIAFPLSVFVEWKNAFQSSRTVIAGTAVVFKF